MQPFWRYSTLKNGMTLKSGYGVLQGHWKRRGSIGLSRSLKLVPFKSLGAVSYSPSIVTMAHVSAAILEIFTVKKWPDLENMVRVHLRSLEMRPFDRSHTSSYQPSIVTMAVSAAILEIFSVKEWPDLENMVRVHLRSLEMTPFDRSHTSSY